MLFRRNRKDFERLVLDEVPSLFRVALRLTANRAAAEDLVQETLLRAYKSFDHVEIRDFGLRPWLFKILHHLFFNERNAQKKHRVLPAEPPWDLLADQHPDPWPEIDPAHLNWEQFDEEIKHGVEALAPEYRIVLLLWALEQMNYKEIAAVCNIPEGTVMSRLFRARKEMAHKLAGYAQTHRLRLNHNAGHRIDHAAATTPVVNPKGP